MTAATIGSTARDAREPRGADDHATCLHCGQPYGASRFRPYCCLGCRSVRGLLESSGLLRFYELRGEAGVPAPEPPTTPPDRAWLEPIAARVSSSDGPVAISLGVQGVHCAACVWVLQTLFERTGHGGRIEVNPALGRIELLVGKELALDAYVESVEALGYRLGPPSDEPERSSDGLLLRAVLCLALAANGSFFAAAIYLGLAEGLLFDWLSRLSYAAAAIAFVVGAPVFARGALEALRRRVLHLDLPITVGVALAFAGTTWSFFAGEGRAAYVDTVTAFIGLMLLGRFLQRRVVERNRRELLAEPGLDALRSRRLDGATASLVPTTTIRRDDRLRIVPGDFFPVAARLEGSDATLSLAFIDGESAPRVFAEGTRAPAGAFNVGDHAVDVRAEEDFSASQVARLLGTRPRADRAEDAPWWQRIGGAYVVFVLAAAGAGFLLWFTPGESPVAALEVATAVLVVTCPCAFGIALPLAYERIVAELRRVGVFVREPSFFARARKVRTIVFDKTGTLTTGRLRLERPEALDTLSQDERAALHAMVSRTSHPKALAVLDALDERGPAASIAAEVREVPGRGLVARIHGREHRLGAPGWAAAGPAPGADVVYAIDGAARLALATAEDLRPEARAELARLAGRYDLHVASGDREERVRVLARAAGIPEVHAHGDLDPDAKARFVAAHRPEETLMVGDGLNDAPAFAVALASATPSVERPFLASRADFYFLTPGLEAVAHALRGARVLAKSVRANLAFAVAYNVAVVALAFAGLMRPWLAAILMPASSLASTMLTLRLTRLGRNAWKS